MKAQTVFLLGLVLLASANGCRTSAPTEFPSDNTELETNTVDIPLNSTAPIFGKETVECLSDEDDSACLERACTKNIELVKAEAEADGYCTSNQLGIAGTIFIFTQSVSDGVASCDLFTAPTCVEGANRFDISYELLPAPELGEIE